MISRVRASRCTMSPTSRRALVTMPKIQIQFHAEPREALTLAAKWAAKHDLTVVFERFFPQYETIAPTNGEAFGASEKLDRADRVSLCRGDPDLGVATAHEFVSQNPGCLFLSVGPRDDEGLRESALGGATDNPETLLTWRSVIRQAKSEMHKGAVVRSPNSASAEPVPSHLHTPGAHSLAEQGIKMLAAAGWNQFEFDDCSVDGQAHADGRSES